MKNKITFSFNEEATERPTTVKTNKIYSIAYYIPRFGRSKNKAAIMELENGLYKILYDYKDNDIFICNGHEIDKWSLEKRIDRLFYHIKIGKRPQVDECIKELLSYRFAIDENFRLRA